jgi:hypothetical protein
MLVVAILYLIPDITLAIHTARSPVATRTKAMLICLLVICISGAKLRKKVVKNNGFWKINAIQPVIKARRGKNGEVQIWTKSKLGGIGEGVRFLIRNPIYVFGAE